MQRTQERRDADHRSLADKLAADADFEHSIGVQQRQLDVQALSAEPRTDDHVAVGQVQLAASASREHRRSEVRVADRLTRVGQLVDEVVEVVEVVTREVADVRQLVVSVADIRIGGGPEGVVEERNLVGAEVAHVHSSSVGESVVSRTEG